MTRKNLGTSVTTALITSGTPSIHSSTTKSDYESHTAVDIEENLLYYLIAVIFLLRSVSGMERIAPLSDSPRWRAACCVTPRPRPAGGLWLSDRNWITVALCDKDGRLHQLLVYADDVNMLGENPQMIMENTRILLEASKTIGLEVNPEKTKYIIMSRDENIARNGNIKIGNLSFEEVKKFKYLGATVTNIDDTREEIKHRINMGNACYYSVEKLLSSSLLSKYLKVRIYKTVILLVVLYGCETWTLTLREEHRLRVFENKVLRKIFGAKRDEVTGEWRKLHNTELHALYSSPDIIRNIKSRRLRWAGHVARMGESRNAYRVLVERPEGKRSLGRPRRRWEDNIKMDLREVRYVDRDWINLAQDRDQWRSYVRGGNEPPGSLKANSEIRLRKPAIMAWGDHRANHTISPFWLEDRPPLRRHVDVRSAAGWSIWALHGL
ncbi:hypothetical protein ANN_19772 [Periplaneta americana]|uniref:Reverse transcriptase domain-containing protein n=1 Tax=Periplaneta americana TaxID=6978 RepID=A0ABQ8SBT9_PERAM|nr:hypothetical protein ANN_19772 [Periplaneta americana]